MHSSEEMAAAITRAPGIDPAMCRAVAATRFSRETMIENYLALYRILANNGSGPAVTFEELTTRPLNTLHTIESACVRV